MNAAEGWAIGGSAAVVAAQAVAFLMLAWRAGIVFGSMQSVLKEFSDDIKGMKDTLTPLTLIVARLDENVRSMKEGLSDLTRRITALEHTP